MAHDKQLENLAHDVQKVSLLHIIIYHILNIF